MQDLNLNYVKLASYCSVSYIVVYACDLHVIVHALIRTLNGVMFIMNINLNHNIGDEDGSSSSEVRTL